MTGTSIADPAPISIDIARPTDHWIAASAEPTPTPARGLADLPQGVIGWFEFSVTVPETGWWRLAGGSRARPWLEFAFDPPPSEARGPVRGPFRLDDWVWLDAGNHRLRVIQNNWTGIPHIDTLSLAPPAPGQRTMVRLDRDRLRPVSARGQCAPLRLVAGGHRVAAWLTATFRRDGRLVERREVAVAASDAPQPLAVDVPCDQPGDVTVTISAPPEEVGASGLSPTPVEWRYSVFDTAPVEPRFHKDALVADIDPVAQEPDFGSGETTVATGAAGRYRESAAIGLIRYRGTRDPDAQSWFAYRVEGLQPNQPYLMEIEYPDDAPRVFIAAFRDETALLGPHLTRYAVSIGTETGSIWPQSGTQKTMSMIVWPTTPNARAIIFNYHDGMKAAVSRIRFFAVDERDDPAKPRHRGRDAIYWYEEGDNFRNLVGMGSTPAAVHTPVDRLLRLARATGATTLMPTVVVYGSQLYPSRYHLAFNDQSRDMTAALLLGAQRYGLKVIPELHPRADELVWTAGQKDIIDRRLLLSRHGKTNRFNDRGRRQVPPYYNALDPEVRRWYVGVVRELAERYRDYPTFAGIALRTSVWANGAFNNFVSIDWGYNPEIIRRYFAETGAAVPAGLDLRDHSAEATGLWPELVLGTQREAWISWRCRTIAELYRDLVATVRRVRPDLTLVLDLSAMAFNQQPFGHQALREAGVDLALLSHIRGLEVVDGRFLYGAAVADTERRRANAGAAFAPNALADGVQAAVRPSTLSTMHYHELPGQMWPSVKLGLPKPPREPWVSAAVEPPPPFNRARYARLVAEHDVYTIGNGGNGYVFGGEGIGDFFAEFSALPRRPFAVVDAVEAPFVARANGDIAFIVNTSAQPRTARVVFKAQTAVFSLRTGAQIATAGESVSLRLAPFSMLSFRMTGADLIKAVAAD